MGKLSGKFGRNKSDSAPPSRYPSLVPTNGHFGTQYMMQPVSGVPNLPNAHASSMVHGHGPPGAPGAHGSIYWNGTQMGQPMQQIHGPMQPQQQPMPRGLTNPHGFMEFENQMQSESDQRVVNQPMDRPFNASAQPNNRGKKTGTSSKRESRYNQEDQRSSNGQRSRSARPYGRGVDTSPNAIPPPPSFHEAHGGRSYTRANIPNIVPPSPTHNFANGPQSSTLSGRQVVHPGFQTQNVEGSPIRPLQPNYATQAMHSPTYAPSPSIPKTPFISPGSNKMSMASPPISPAYDTHDGAGSPRLNMELSSSPRANGEMSGLPRQRAVTRSLSVGSCPREQVPQSTSQSPAPKRVHPPTNPSTPRRPNFSVCAKQGKRPYMEDESAIKVMDKYTLYGIFDGHSGGKASKYCCDHLLENIVKHMGPQLQHASIMAALHNGFRQTEAEFMDMAHRYGWDDGTTVLVVCVSSGAVHFAHCGDSRLALVTNATPSSQVLTEDHKPNFPREYQMITQRGGQVSPSHSTYLALATHVGYCDQEV